MKLICKFILCSIVAMMDITIATAFATGSDPGDAIFNTNGKTCSSGCDANDSTKVLVCDQGSKIQRLLQIAKPNEYCANPSANRKVRRWLRSGRALCGPCNASPVYFSCQAALNAGKTSSGMYQLRVDGTTEFTAYCDQETAGGGWMLFASYKHARDDFTPLNSFLPTDPKNGYSNVILEQLGYNYTDVQSLRFYCTSSSHSRVLHFINNNTNILQMAWDGTPHGNSPSYWNTHDFSTLLSDHNASLPLSVNDLDSQSGSLLDYAFYYYNGAEDTNSKYFSVSPATGYFQCDDNIDYIAGGRQDTHHTIWVRMNR